MGPDPIEIEDYYPHQTLFRYGGLHPPHERIEEILSEGLDRYRRRLESFIPFLDQLDSVRLHPDPERPDEPAWINDFFTPLDAVALFGLISQDKPRRYLEIGSGQSTRFAFRAKKLNSPETVIHSIDPCPRAEIDVLCEKVVRSPLEACDPALFDALQPGDVLFFDGTHRVLQNSDVTVFFLEVLPRVKPGVYIHIHDIFWPYDYPEEWVRRYYSEQYMLAVLLLFAPEKIEIILPNAFISWRTKLGAILNRLWDAPHLEGIKRHGGSFWFVKKQGG